VFENLRVGYEGDKSSLRLLNLGDGLGPCLLKQLLNHFGDVAGHLPALGGGGHAHLNLLCELGEGDGVRPFIVAVLAGESRALRQVYFGDSLFVRGTVDLQLHFQM
jgi:hypothetical protein